jgi:hypothetical protein
MKRLNLPQIALPAIIVSMMSFTPYRNTDKDGPKELKRTMSSYSKPNKKYTKDVVIAVKDAVNTIKMYDNESGLSSSIKSQVNKLSAYAKEGLDLDLVMYNVSRISKEKALSTEETEKLLDEAASTWNTRMKINGQKEVIIQLQREVSANLQSAIDLKQNTDHILSSLQMISSEQVLRNPKIKIFPVLFPIENINARTLKPVSELVEAGLTSYKTSGLSTNKAELSKFTATGNAVTVTLNDMLPNINLLSDKEDTKYPVSAAVLNSSATNLGTIGIFDMVKINQTYAGLNTEHTNYNVLVNQAIDYINNLNTCFKSGVGSISKQNIQDFLASERQAYESIALQQKSLTATIEDLTKLQRSITETLR